MVEKNVQTNPCQRAEREERDEENECTDIFDKVVPDPSDALGKAGSASFGAVESRRRVLAVQAVDGPVNGFLGCVGGHVSPPGSVRMSQRRLCL